MVSHVRPPESGGHRWKRSWRKFCGVVKGVEGVRRKRAGDNTMCDQLFENYASAVNSYESATSDLIPGLLLFTGSQCSEGMFPSAGGGSFNFASNTYTSASDPIQRGVTEGWDFVVSSFFIPFNFKLVTFQNAAKTRTSQFVGPFFTTDTRLLNWQSVEEEVSLASDPVTFIYFTDILDWPSQALQPMCLGTLEFIGPFSLTRFTPQSQRCDTFMTDTWCDPDTPRIDNVECSCFKELPDIEQKSKELGVDLPVICFGIECATRESYKTLGMLSKPCNLTICQQTINATPGIVNQGTDTVFCGGQFFQQNGNLVQPTVTAIPGPPAKITKEDAPWYVWIMLGASALLFLVLVYLMFGSSRTKGSSISRQIQRIAREYKSRRASRPDFGTTYKDDITNI